MCQALVVHICSPSYSGGRDKDHGSKPAHANSCKTLSLKTHHKKGLVEWLKVLGPEFDPQHCKKKIPGKTGHGDHTCNPSTKEAEAKGSKVQCQPELHSKIN
jgi:hypothetical protein